MKDRFASDETLLVAQLQKGNALAFEVIYHRYKGILYAHAARQLQDPEEINDILHDIFSNLWEGRTTINLTNNLTAYLFQAVRNRIINSMLKSKRSDDYVHSFAKYLELNTSNTDYLVRERLLKEQIQKEIDALPQKMRVVFEKSRMGGLTHKQIADELGITEQSVRSHVKGALRILRGKLTVSSYLIMLSQF